MAEKGGKGFPVSKKKSASKAPTSNLESLNLKEKDANSSGTGRKDQVGSSDSDSGDSVEEIVGGSTKSGKNTSDTNTKTSKKVSFDNLKTGGKSSGKGTWGKGASDGKTGKGGGKGGPPLAKILTEVELKLGVDLPENARILKDCEAATMLNGIQDYLQILLDDPMIKIPESFGKSLKYVQTVDHYTDSLGVTQALHKLKKHGVTDGEICMIANACPETTEEVYALIPSLKDKRNMNEGPIVNALVDLAKLKHHDGQIPHCSPH